MYPCSPATFSHVCEFYILKTLMGVYFQTTLFHPSRVAESITNHVTEEIDFEIWRCGMALLPDLCSPD